jgi:DNA-binding NarL/FixJ family response regulator
LEVLRAFMNKVPMRKKKLEANPFSKLAPRELDVLFLLLQGKEIKEIEPILGLSKSAVATLKRRIFEKTEANNIIELMNMANASGITK